ncbi:MAG: DUF4062 domain-containing protein [Bryobacteraceae bacterium]
MRKVLTVFIASPCDLADERRRAFEVVAEINEAIKNIDWSIDLLGWEDTLPGYGRPQDLINRDVERCDLFIGLLWRRWGTPPGQDSRFTSGFEEEFSNATLRRERTHSPEIWMFFRTVEVAQIADAGTQLQRVIDFRESLIAGKKVLFKEFEDVDGWEKVLRKCLFRHVLDIARTRSGTPEGPAEQPAPTSKTIPMEADASGARMAGRQLAELTHSLIPAFETGDLRDIAAAIGDPREVTFLAVRSLLFSAALVAVSESSDTPLPVHELNTLYRHRDRLLATDNELYILLRTVLADSFDVKPGWYWFRNHEPPATTGALVAIALLDNEATARARSFEILRHAQVPVSPSVRDPVLVRGLMEIPSNVRDAAWAYLVDVIKPEDLDAVRESADGTWLEPRLDWLLAWTESNRNLDRFLPHIPDPQLIPDQMKQSILAGISDLADASLEALKSMPVPGLSEAAVAELRARGTLGEGGRTPTVRRHGLTLASSFRGFLGSSSEAGATDEDEYDRLSRENTDSIRNSLDWYQLAGPAAYQLLVERGEIAKEIARKDLTERFQRIRDESHERLEEALGTEIAGIQRQAFEKYQEFLTRLYTAGALAALATEPTREDLIVARQCLNDNDDAVRTAAVGIVASRGTAADVRDLIDIARSGFGEQRRLALDGVVRLTADKLEAARTLIVLEGRDMRRTALSLTEGLGDGDALPFLEELLAHEDEETRLGAIGQVIKRLNHERLANLLCEYTERGGYFYNVAVWLDRVLYAPPPIGDYYAAELVKKLEAASH